MNAHEHCPHCDANLPPRTGRGVRYAAVGLTWIVAMAMAMGLAMAALFLPLTLPVVVVGGVSAISSAHRWAFDEQLCDACGKYVEDTPASVAGDEGAEVEPTHLAA